MAIAAMGENATMDQIRRRNKWDNDDYVCKGLIFKDFKYTLKHKKEELTLVELGSHLRIEESFRAQIVTSQRATMLLVHSDWTKNLVSSSVLNNCGYKQVTESAKFVLSKHGHVHFKRMQDMSKDGLILSFDMDTKKCKTCMLTKITKKSFQNVKRETEVLELIHSDLCDLHATPSLGNKKYFVKFINDASRSKDSGLIGEVSNKRNKIILYELWTKRKPSLNYLRVWGCMAVVRLPDPKLKALGKRGIECIFVGYDEHSKAFRFYVIEPNKLVSINSNIESRDAIFGIRDGVFDQHSYCFNIEDDSKTFDEGMKSHDVAFWKEAINDEMDSIYYKTADCYGITSQSDCSSDGCEDNFLKCTPMDTSEKLMPNKGQDVSQLEYSMVIGCLMYAMTCTWPDIDFTMGNLSSGWVFLLNGGAISWPSKKQTYITSSTMESEFVALAAAGKEAEWLRNLILEIPLWSKPIAPISIRCDSAATLAKAYSQMYNGKSRHLGVRHSMIRELIMNEVVSIEFVRS
ncbi:zinc finger, CCHC-type containing protein [Tanacetum coccineum]